MVLQCSVSQLLKKDFKPHAGRSTRDKSTRKDALTSLTENKQINMEVRKSTHEIATRINKLLRQQGARL